MIATTGIRHGLTLAAAVALMATLTAAAPAAGPDGLTAVKAKRVDKAFVLKGTDFRPYTAVMLDPVEVAFDKNWQRDYNNSSRDPSRRVTDADAAKMLGEVRAGFAKTFAKTFAKAGYRIAEHPGPDVLRVGATVSDIRVTAPDTMTSGRSRTYSREAGSAAVTLDARDSTSGKLLGRAIDSRDIGDSGMMMWQRSSVSNNADFERVFESWSKAAVKALADLKASSAAAAPAAAATPSH